MPFITKNIGIPPMIKATSSINSMILGIAHRRLFISGFLSGA